MGSGYDPDGPGGEVVKHFGESRVRARQELTTMAALGDLTGMV